MTSLKDYTFQKEETLLFSIYTALKENQPHYQLYDDKTDPEKKNLVIYKRHDSGKMAPYKNYSLKHIIDKIEKSPSRKVDHSQIILETLIEKFYDSTLPERWEKLKIQKKEIKTNHTKEKILYITYTGNLYFLRNPQDIPITGIITTLNITVYKNNSIDIDYRENSKIEILHYNQEKNNFETLRWSPSEHHKAIALYPGKNKLYDYYSYTLPENHPEKTKTLLTLEIPEYEKIENLSKEETINLCRKIAYTIANKKIYKQKTPLYHIPDFTVDIKISENTTEIKEKILYGYFLTENFFDQNKKSIHLNVSSPKQTKNYLNPNEQYIITEDDHDIQKNIKIIEKILYDPAENGYTPIEKNYRSYYKYHEDIIQKQKFIQIKDTGSSHEKISAKKAYLEWVKKEKI